MKIKDFCLEVARLERGRKEVNITQIREVVRVINDITQGQLYKIIRKMED